MKHKGTHLSFYFIFSQFGEFWFTVPEPQLKTLKTLTFLLISGRI